MGMEEAGYSHESASTICRALFYEQSEKYLRKAFKLFDTDRSGFIDACEFQRALPLMGENVPAEKIDDLFTQVDRDTSGKLDLEEFCFLVKAMNPKTRISSGSSGTSVRATLTAVADTWDTFSASIGGYEHPDPQQKRKK